MLWTSEVDLHIKTAKTIKHQYNVKDPENPIIKILGNGAIYKKAEMAADADGSPRAKKIDPLNGQLETSLRKPKWTGDSQYVDSETIPYFVLPGNFDSVSEVTCNLGDLALIRWKGKEVFAIFADVGPKKSIGEGSIKTIEALGESPWNSDKTLIVKGIPFGVEYLVFPESTSAARPIPSTYAQIQSVGLEVFRQKFTNVYSLTSEQIQEHWQENDVEVWEIIHAPQFKVLVDLNCRPSPGIHEIPPITVIPANTIVKNQTQQKSADFPVDNVGIDNKGSLWIMVAIGNYKGFVRASLKYIMPLG